MTKIFKTALLGALILGFSGCASKIIVTPVKDSEILPVMEKSGIYYTLPKTAVDIKIPFSVIDTSQDKYGINFKECAEECGDNISTEKKCKPVFDTEFDYLIRDISVSSTVIPDDNHRYYINVDLEWFSDFSHNVTLTTAGIYASSNNNVSNPVPKIAVEVAKFAAKTIGMFLPLSVEDFVDIPDKHEPNTCKAIIATRKVLEAYKEKVDEIREKVKPLRDERKKFLTIDGINSDAGVFEKVLSHYDKQILKKDSSLNDELYRQLMLNGGLGGIKKAQQETSFSKRVREFVLSRRIIPNEFENFVITTNEGVEIENAPVQTILKSKWRLFQIVKRKDASGADVIQAIEKKEESEEYKKFVSKEGYSVTINPVEYPLTQDQKDQATIREKDSTALRYRLPVSSEIVVKNKDRILLTTQEYIAQYGPIAFLPTEFRGVEGNLELAIHPNTGGLKEVVISTSPISTDTMNDFSTAMTDTMTTYKDREITELERQKKLLELRQAVKELEAKE